MDVNRQEKQQETFDRFHPPSRLSSRVPIFWDDLSDASNASWKLIGLFVVVDVSDPNFFNLSIDFVR